MRILVAAAALAALTACSGGSAGVGSPEWLADKRDAAREGDVTPVSEIERSIAQDLQGMSDGPGKISVDCPPSIGLRVTRTCAVTGGGHVVSVVNDVYDGVSSVRVTRSRYGGFTWDFE